MSIEYPVNKKYYSDLRRIDWDFTGSKGDEGGASYHWYPARFIPQLPGIFINYFSVPGGKVLDPFCGSGTTLVEAYKFGREATGIDLNPVAVLIAKARLTKYSSKHFADFEEILGRKIQENLLSLISKNSLQELKLIVPNFEENFGWYHAETLLELAAIWKSLHEVVDSKYFNVGIAAFSASLARSSSQEKHWGWICDNVKPKILNYKPAKSNFLAKLEAYKNFATEIQNDAKDLQESDVKLSEIKVLQGDSSILLSSFENDSFDLVVTSPPYFNVTDYVKSQRLSNLWLVQDFESLKNKEIGARYRRQGKNSLQVYLEQMGKVFSQLYRILKKGSFCCVVLGESSSHDPYISTFQKICGEIGFKTDDLLERNVSDSRRLIPSVRKETIFILKK